MSHGPKTRDFLSHTKRKISLLWITVRCCSRESIKIIKAGTRAHRTMHKAPRAHRVRWRCSCESRQCLQLNQMRCINVKLANRSKCIAMLKKPKAHNDQIFNGFDEVNIWRFDEWRPVQPMFTYSIPCVRISDGIPLHKNRVKTSGGNITIEALLRSDFGFYQCIVSNEVATITASTQLIIEGTQPHAPYNLTGTATENSVTISWSPGYSGGPDFKQDYTVWYREAGITEWIQKPVLPSGNTQLTVSNLLPGKTYEFQVVGKNALGDGMMSTVVTIRTLGELATQWLKLPQPNPFVINLFVNLFNRNSKIGQAENTIGDNGSKRSCVQGQSGRCRYRYPKPFNFHVTISICNNFHRSNVQVRGRVNRAMSTSPNWTMVFSSSGSRHWNAPNWFNTIRLRTAPIRIGRLWIGIAFGPKTHRF